MFFSSLRAPLVTLVAYVAIVSSAPSVAPRLTVKTSTSDLNIDRLENLNVTTTVVNTGRVSLKLLNDPRGVLDPFPENSFTFTNPSGSQPSFVGARASYNSTLAAGLDDPTAFTVLSPGGSVNVTHDLSAAYDFTRSGTGEYSIEPSNLFIYIDADGVPKDLYATVGDIAKVKLSSDLGVSGRVRNKRAPTFPGCKSWEAQDLLQAINGVRQRTMEAMNHLALVFSQDTVTRRYRRWFGRYIDRFRLDIGIALWWISQWDLFSEVRFTCLEQNEANAGPIYTYNGDTDWLYVTPRALASEDLLVYMVHQAVHRAVHLAAREVDRVAQADYDDPHHAPHQARNDAEGLFDIGIRDRGTGVFKCLDYANFQPDVARSNAENYAHFIVNRRGE